MREIKGENTRQKADLNGKQTSIDSELIESTGKLGKRETQ